MTNPKNGMRFWIGDPNRADYSKHGTIIDDTPVRFPECVKVKVWIDWQPQPEMVCFGSLVLVERPASPPKLWAVYQSATVPTMGSCENRLSPLFERKEDAEKWLSSNFVKTGHHGMGTLGTPEIK